MKIWVRICEFLFFGPGGLFLWDVHVGNTMPVDASTKDNFFSLVVQVLVAVLVAELLLLSVATEDSKGFGIWGNVTGSSMRG